MLTPEQMEEAVEAAMEATHHAMPFEYMDAALTAALPVIERAKWQPIETAPKDGTSILLFASDYPPLSYMGVGQWAFADPDLGFVEGWFWPFAIRPTHWMPLPVPPALAGEER